MAHVFATKLVDQEMVMMTILLEWVNEGLPVEQMFGTTEANSAAEIMMENDELLLSSGVVYKN